MARPHICFLQSQSLSFEPATLFTHHDVHEKRLSTDDATNASTGIVRLAAGHNTERPGALRQDLELFVLAGQCVVAGRTLKRHHYARIPAGHDLKYVASDGGADILWMPGPRAVETSLSQPIIHHDTFAMPWTTGAEGSVTGKPLSSSIFTKKLWLDPKTQEQTFLYSALPQHAPPSVMPGKFGHPIIEELFTLAGEYAFGDVGRMGPGGYAWWRENELHGPAGSATGYSLFIRVHGGALVNHFDATAAPFSYEPDYDPALPEALIPTAKPFPFPDPY